ncbi:DUF6557 family protein [Arenibacter certesii]|uniref:Uncharacterized protein n=1 Tax=Arenibacter certesii TaxID=228955 RepID=A0A918J517_9FLAO|nr:DUF6557 family protein [Arenibacter certesii]GGW48736.1 hypothetical protein GCM10007383_35970 [Arenibacter certesii]
MTFNKLIQTHTWASIASKFLTTYPEAEKNIKGYELVFEKLKKMDPEKTDMGLGLKSVIGEDENYVDVFGLHKNPNTKEENYPQGIEFIPWRQWLGMEVSKESLAIFTAQDIIVHCLYEMAFVGFSEEDIQASINSIKKNKKERKPVTEEEQDKINAAVEEILKEWRE